MPEGSTIVAQLAQTIADAMRSDDRVVLVGEDVRDGGMLGLSRVAAGDEKLAPRIVPTPLTPAAVFGHAAGLAMGGVRPWVLLPSAAALVEGYAGLVELARVHTSTAGERSAHVLILAPNGPGFGLGGDSAASVETALTALPGLRVLSCGDASQVCGLVRHAASFSEGPEPTVVLIAREALLCSDDGIETAIEPAVRVLHQGAHATVLSWGPALRRAQQAVQAARAEGIDVGLLDVVSLAPLDQEQLVAAVQQTGKLVIVHAGGRSQGTGAELAALMADLAILHLDAPILRVTGSAGPWPRVAEQSALPAVDAICEAISRVAHY
ncbi:MAG: transketolase C-terminal domain-containing protein [Nannocystaceae bacterium]